MSEEAGVKNGGDGLLLTSLAMTPLKDLTVYFAKYWVDDTFNTAYANSEYSFRPVKDLGVSLGVQYADQRSTGGDLLGAFNTWNVGARVQLAWRWLTLIGAMSATGDQASLRTPYGIWPGYLQLVETAFDRGVAQPTTHEGDLDIIYAIPRVRNLSVRFRNAYVAAGGGRCSAPGFLDTGLMVTGCCTG